MNRTRTLQDSRTLADGINTLNARRTRRAESAANVLAAVVFGVLGGSALWHWFATCAGAATC